MRRGGPLLGQKMSLLNLMKIEESDYYSTACSFLSLKAMAARKLPKKVHSIFRKKRKTLKTFFSCLIELKALSTGCFGWRNNRSRKKNVFLAVCTEF